MKIWKNVLRIFFNATFSNSNRSSTDVAWSLHCIGIRSFQKWESASAPWRLVTQPCESRLKRGIPSKGTPTRWQKGHLLSARSTRYILKSAGTATRNSTTGLATRRRAGSCGESSSSRRPGPNRWNGCLGGWSNQRRRLITPLPPLAWMESSKGILIFLSLL